MNDLPFILVVTLPFIGALLVRAASSLGEKVAPKAAVAVGIITAAVSVIAISRVEGGEGALGLAVDGLGYFVALASSVLGALILIYSLGYMAHEHNLTRFYILILLTIGSVNCLALSGNALVLVAAWIACSVLTSSLVGFEHEHPAAVEGSRNATIFARASELLLVLGFVFLTAAAGGHGFGIGDLIQRAGTGNATMLALAAFLILAAAMIRSAQIPLHVWLPGAMEAPSPASALLDAATIMNVGVYVVMRFYPLFERVAGWTSSVLWVGAVTIIASALMALYADDLKTMLAYSTMSQLGYMFFAVGTGSILGAQFHMMSHAIFKTLLFLAAGSVVHATGTRNMEVLSGLGSHMPVTSKVFFVGVMGLSGVPFMSGFFSKDMILAGALSRHEYVALTVAALGAVLTVVYSWSAYFRVFAGDPSKAAKAAHESPLSMEVPMVILSILTLVFWLFIGIESGELGHTVPGVEVHTISPLYLIEETFASTAFLISLGALVMGFIIVRRRKEMLLWMDSHASRLVSGCRHGFYIDRLYTVPGHHRERAKDPSRHV